jgi:hypothetical protein
MYSISLLPRISVRGMKPTASAPMSGFDSQSSTANDPAEKEDREHVECRQANPPDQRQADQQVQRNGCAEHFGEVAGRYRHLAQNP